MVRVYFSTNLLGYGLLMSKVVAIRGAADIEKLRVAGALLNRVMREVVAAVRVGVTTRELDKLAYDRIVAAGAKPSFLNYHGFPATLCTSVDDEVVHGIPCERVLEDGSILSIDCGLILNGWHSDHAVTVCVGDVSEKARALVRTTEECLARGIAAMVPGNRLGDVGYAVQSLAEAQGYGVVRDMCGHGIGRNLHEPPQLPNYGRPGQGLELRAGMVIAIEPMVNMGGWKIRTLKDGWTTVTADGTLSAHAEHTVAITADGPLILTSSE